jgi:hypothetical protein
MWRRRAYGMADVFFFREADARDGSAEASGRLTHESGGKNGRNFSLIFIF